MVKRFFTPEMAARLKELRVKSGLTQDQVGQRLGLQGRDRRSFVSRLERGKEPNPALSTIVRFLHACGARMSALSDLLDRIEPLPEDPKLKQVVTQAWHDTDV